MPKATQPAQSAPTLARNQACHTCRKRKQKCDAQRPYCGGCIRSWKARGQAISDNGGTPQCTYDDPWDFVPGNTGQDGQTIDHLKARIGELEKSLATGPPQANSGSHAPYIPTNGMFDPAALDLPMPDMSMLGAFDLPDMDHLFNTPSLTPPMTNTNSSSATGSPYEFGALVLGSWPHNLPSPDMLHHLVEVFFSHFALSTRILHKPSFLHSLSLSPNSTKFPASSLLHAICAYASMFSPAVPTPIIADVPPPPEGEDKEQVRPKLKRPETFGDYQARMARVCADESTAIGENMVQNFQAITILGWYWFAQARWVELWIWSGIALRHSVPLGLNVSDEVPSTLNRSGKTALITPTDDSREGRIENEMRRNAFWAAYILERYACASATWANSLDELDISTELPVTLSVFENGSEAPGPRQRLSTASLLTTHPPQVLDAFGMHIKAVHLLNLAHTHNLRFRGSPQALQYSDPREAPAFKQLDGLLVSFVYSLPAQFRDPFRADGGACFDPDLYMVAVLPHLSAILLHDPHVDATNPADPSAERILAAARGILHTVYILCSTSFDISLLVHSCCQAWWLAARVLVRFLKAKIDAQDRDAAVALRGEVQVFQLALTRIGEKVPMGQRFGKMLTELLDAEMAIAEGLLSVGCHVDDTLFDGRGGGPLSGVGIAVPFTLQATVVELESPPEEVQMPLLPQIPDDPHGLLNGMMNGMDMHMGLQMNMPVGLDLDFGTLGAG